MVISGRVWEKRFLYGVTGASAFGFFLMLIAVATDYWMVLSVPHGFYRNVTKQYLVGANSGLWRLCRIEVKNLTHPDGVVRKYELDLPLRHTTLAAQFIVSYIYLKLSVKNRRTIKITSVHCKIPTVFVRFRAAFPVRIPH
jgi:hypothetical protein